jgi:hypothetical protein
MVGIEILFSTILVILFSGAHALDYDYESGPDCIVHHPPHNEEFSCGNLCDPSLLNAEFVTAVYLTGFYANFDCLRNKSSIKVSIFFIFCDVEMFFSGPQKNEISYQFETVQTIFFNKTFFR